MTHPFVGSLRKGAHKPIQLSMKQLLRTLFLGLLVLACSTVWSQGFAKKLLTGKAAQHLSVTATIATQAEGLSSLGDYNLQKLTNVNLGELSVAYKINDRFSLGLGTVAGLGNCGGGYTNAEGAFVAYHFDEEDDDDDDDDELDDDMDDMDNDDDCDGEELDNLMAILTTQPFANLPIFAQVSGGYSFGANAPAYSVMLGARQPLIGGLNLTGGFRFSDVLHKLPTGATEVISSSGLRLEIGLNWSL